MQLNAPKFTAWKNLRGVTLIEALVALFIMSIGLLGIAGLQATSIAAGHASGQRSLAVFLSADIVERMRANVSAVATYASATTPAGKSNGCTDTATTDAKITCSDVEVAEEDVLAWRSALTAAFANMSPTATITVDTSTTPATVMVDIDWTERGEAMTYVVDNIRM